MTRKLSTALQFAGLATLAALAMAEYRLWSLDRSEMTLLVTGSGVLAETPGVIADISSEPDPASIRLRAARALLAHELDRKWMAELSPAEREAAEARGLLNLQRARDIAARELRERPSSWQAAMVLGGATYLSLARLHDPAVAADRARWEEPLRLSQRLAPGQREPIRLLTAAYLSEWTRLSPQERQDLIPFLKTAFSDPQTADLLLVRWIQIAPSLKHAYEPVPDTPEAWWKLQLVYAAKGDWERYSDARSRWDIALKGRLESLVDQAERAVASGDAAAARSALHEVLARMPKEGRYAKLFTRTVAALPAGPAGRSQARTFREWLSWSRDRCLLESCPLPAETIRRVGWLAELPGTHQAAEVALMSLDLPQAEHFERRWAIPRSQAWSSFYLLKARVLADRGDRAAARASLASISADVRQSTAAWAVTRHLRQMEASDTTNGSPLTQRFSAWIREGRSARLEIITTETAHGFLLDLDAVPRGGSAVGLYWNGSLVGFFPAWEGQSIRAQISIPAGAHTLLVETPTGPVAAPGTVRLIGSEG